MNKLFDKDGYVLVNNVISKDLCKLLENELKLTKKVLSKLTPNEISSGDSAVKDNSFPYYGSVGSESLLQMMTEKIENTVGKKLYPTYSYSRIYYKGAVLPKHVDRPACQYSATITISADKNNIWDIYLNNNKVTIPIGSMAVYKGCEIEHWREPYDGEEQVQIFIHYVDQDGVYANQKYDKREYLGMPK